jgi:hypothetical protein
MSGHPPSHRLEGHAAGDHDEGVAAHLLECEACRAYVERSVAAAKAAPTPLVLERALAVHGHRGRRRVLSVALGLAPIAAAAALVLIVRGTTPGGTSTRPGPSVEAIHFKGGLQLVAIRERGVNQERFAGSVAVRAGDMLRVEIAIEREGPVTAGVLAEDGAWLPLVAPTSLGPGTHLSERAARVDDRPTAGVILAGNPDDVGRARATRDFTEVAAMEVHPEP